MGILVNFIGFRSIKALMRLALASAVLLTTVTGTAAAEEWTNSLGMEFVEIPGGTFLMGSPEGEEGRNANEGPQHQVTLTQGFWMGKYEVTQAQWEEVMGENPSSHVHCGGDCPVEFVSWYDTQRFIAELNGMDAETQYRLPTEAEWEYAARAGTTTAYSFGPSYAGIGEHAWYSGNSSDSEGQKVHPVGGKLPNGWGLHDMHGNVSEWTSDVYEGYTSSAVTDPTGEGYENFRVFRGGSWNDLAKNLRSAYRDDYTAGGRTSYYGVRIVAVRTPAKTLASLEISGPSTVDEERPFPTKQQPTTATGAPLM